MYQNEPGAEFGQLIGVNSSGGTSYSYGYDDAGRLAAVLQVTAGKEFGSAFLYDALDRVTQRLFPDGETFDYSYDGTRLVGIHGAQDPNQAFTGAVLESADYDAFGRMQEIEVGQTAGGAALVTNTFSYHATSARLTRVQGAAPSSTALDLFVTFDGMGRLVEQTGTLGAESVDREFTYDGLSRLKTAVGPWEKPSGESGNVTWTYSYDALGNLRGQTSSRSDHRTWSYGHATKPHVLTKFEQANEPNETPLANIGGEVATLLRAGSAPASLTWNAQGKLHRFKDSTYSYDVFDEATLVVAGPSGSASSIVRVGEDFEYDIGASRANKYFSVQGVRIASLATSYVADDASVPPVLRFVLRHSEPLAAPAAAALLGSGLLSLASLTLRRRTPVWLAAPGVGVLSLTLVVVPYTADAATLTSGPGAYGRHGEPILAYILDHLGTIRGAVNQAGTVVETRDYAPFGESIAHTGTFSVQHRFTGQPQDDQTGGLYNYGARFYNAKWGRFVSPDEMVQGFDSQGLNPFTYVLNRPTSATDPTGNLIWNGVSVSLLSGVLGSYQGSGPWGHGKRHLTVSGTVVIGDSDAPSVRVEGLHLLPGPRDEPPLAPIDGWKLPLDAIAALQQYFPDLDLSKIRVHEDLPFFLPEDVDGYASGNDIYLRPGLYDPYSPEGLALIGHELKHSADQQELGLATFRARCFREYLALRLQGQTSDDAYENISFEKDARAVESKILRELSK